MVSTAMRGEVPLWHCSQWQHQREENKLKGVYLRPKMPTSIAVCVLSKHINDPPHWLSEPCMSTYNSNTGSLSTNEPSRCWQWCLSKPLPDWLTRKASSLTPVVSLDSLDQKWNPARIFLSTSCRKGFDVTYGLDIFTWMISFRTYADVCWVNMQRLSPASPWASSCNYFYDIQKKTYVFFVFVFLLFL